MALFEGGGGGGGGTAREGGSASGSGGKPQQPHHAASMPNTLPSRDEEEKKHGLAAAARSNLQKLSNVWRSVTGMQGLMVESHEKHDEWMKERMAGFTHGQTQEDVLAGASDHTDAQFVHEALEFKKLNDPSPYSAAGGNDSTREEPPEDELDGSEEGEPPAEQAEEEEDPFERLARLQAGTSWSEVRAEAASKGGIINCSRSAFGGAGRF